MYEGAGLPSSVSSTFGRVLRALNTDEGSFAAIKKLKQDYCTWEECTSLREIQVCEDSSQLYLLIGPARAPACKHYKARRSSPGEE